MKNAPVYKWLLIITNSDDEEAYPVIVKSTLIGMRRYMLSIILNDKGNDREEYDGGTTRLTDLGKGEHLYGYNQFYDYHINYEAYRLDTIPVKNIQED